MEELLTALEFFPGASPRQQPIHGPWRQGLLHQVPGQSRAGTYRGFVQEMCESGHPVGCTERPSNLSKATQPAGLPGVPAGTGPEWNCPRFDLALPLGLADAHCLPLDHPLQSSSTWQSGHRELPQAPPGTVRHPLPSARTLLPLLPTAQRSGAHCLWASSGLRCVLCDFTYCLCVCACVHVCRGLFLIILNHLPTFTNWRFHVKTRISSFLWKVGSSGHPGPLPSGQLEQGLAPLVPVSQPGPPHSSLGTSSHRGRRPPAVPAALAPLCSRSCRLGCPRGSRRAGREPGFRFMAGRTMASQRGPPLSPQNP